MKNRILISWLFTPFKFIAGTKALIAGIIVMALISVLSWQSNIRFDGVLDIHMGSSASYLVHAIYQAVTWVTLTWVFYVTARIVSKSETRLIDIAGTMALSQAPLILTALWGFIPGIHIDFGDINLLSLNEIMLILKDNKGILILNMIVFVISTIWVIVLRYNAYTVSANVKGMVAIVSFAVAILVSEIISKIVLYLIIRYSYEKQKCTFAIAYHCIGIIISSNGCNRRTGYIKNQCGQCFRNAESSGQ
jgi:hypothetical protein